jgi:hypothetical protein
VQPYLIDLAVGYSRTVTADRGPGGDKFAAIPTTAFEARLHVAMLLNTYVAAALYYPSVLSGDGINGPEDFF